MKAKIVVTFTQKKEIISERGLKLVSVVLAKFYCLIWMVVTQVFALCVTFHFRQILKRSKNIIHSPTTSSCNKCFVILFLFYPEMKFIDSIIYLYT